MKLLLSSALLATLFISSTSNAQQYQFIATDNSLLTKFCVHSGANDAKKLKATLRRLGVHERKANINTIRCNDESPAQFAYKYGAIDTFNFLNQYSFGKNKVRPSVTISDVAKLTPIGNQKPVVIEVSAN